MAWGIWSSEEEERRWESVASESYASSPFAALASLTDELGPADAAAAATTSGATDANAEGAAATTTPASAAKRAGIPRIVHHIWLGSALPSAYARLRETWEAHHPAATGWEHRLWDDAAVRTLRMVNRAAFDAAPNYGEKSDIARLEILYQHGGLYVDTDFECVAPFDELHTGAVDLYTGRSNTAAAIELNNGLIGATKRHPLLMAAIRKIAAEHSRDSAMSSTQGAALIAKFMGVGAGGGGAGGGEGGSGGDGGDLLSLLSGGAGGGGGDGGGGGGGVDGASRTLNRTGPGMWTRLVLGSLCEVRGRTRMALAWHGMAWLTTGSLVYCRGGHLTAFAGCCPQPLTGLHRHPSLKVIANTDRILPLTADDRARASDPRRRAAGGGNPGRRRGRGRESCLSAVASFRCRRRQLRR